MVSQAYGAPHPLVMSLVNEAICWRYRWRGLRRAAAFPTRRSATGGVLTRGKGLSCKLQAGVDAPDLIYKGSFTRP